jgi:carboxypeptidase family protein
MKLIAPLFLALMLIGCSHESTPTAATPPVMTASSTPTPSASVSLWGFVVNAAGACIENATVEASRGQAQGQRIVQVTPCDVWAYDGGFVFKDLTPGVQITVRASAPGWSTEEKTFVAGEQGTGKAVVIELKKS